MTNLPLCNFCAEREKAPFEAEPQRCGELRSGVLIDTLFTLGEMIMDGIREQLVKKPETRSDRSKTYAVLLAALILAILVVMIVNVVFGATMILIALLIAGGILYGGYWLTGEFYVEYEYCCSGGELTVDKIINRKRRKPMCSVNLRNAERFMKEPFTLPDATEISACGDEFEKYAIEYNDSKYGRSVLVFTPDERMLEMIKPYLPRLS